MSEGHLETSVQLRNGIKGQNWEPFTSPLVQGGVVCNSQIEFEGQGQRYGNKWKYLLACFLGFQAHFKRKVSEVAFCRKKHYFLTEFTISL